MPRYFFDIEDVELRRDTEGEELEGLSAARIAATDLAAELLKTFPDRFWSIGQWQCTCRDDKGLVLFILHFFATEAPAISRPPI